MKNKRILEPEPKVSHQYLNKSPCRLFSQATTQPGQLLLLATSIVPKYVEDGEANDWNPQLGIQAKSSTNCYWKQLDTIILDMWTQNEHTKKWTAAKITTLRVRPNEGITTHTQIQLTTPVYNPRPLLSNKYIEHLQQNECLMMQAILITLNKSHTSKISYKLLFLCETDVTWCHS